MSFFAHPFLRQSPQKTLVKIYIPAVFAWRLFSYLNILLSALSVARC